MKLYRSFKVGEIIKFYPASPMIAHYGVVTEKLEIGKPAKIKVYPFLKMNGREMFSDKYYEIRNPMIISVKPTAFTHATKKEKAEFAMLRLMGSDDGQ